VEDIAPNLTALVPARKAKIRTVKEGLSRMWLRDCGPDLKEAVLVELFILSQILAVVHLTLDREDALLWSWSVDGVYLSKSGTLELSRFLRFGTRGLHMAAGSLRESFLGIVVGWRNALSVGDYRTQRLARSLIRSRRPLSTFYWGVWWPREFGVGSQPLGQVGVAPRGIHRTPPMVGVKTVSQGDTEEPLDCHYLYLSVHLATIRNDVVFNGA
jgi:hypothetical protein